MLDKICDFFNRQLAKSNTEVALTEHQRHLATAALLVEVATIDQEFDSREFNALKTILRNQFQLSDTELDELSELAHLESNQATSLYQFTQLVNQHFTPEEKFQLIKSMWQIAYADEVLDKYEEYVIRKVAELIHISHSDFIRAKHQTRPQSG